MRNSMSIVGLSNFFGSIIGESLTDSGGTDLHYDYDAALNFGLPAVGQWHDL